MRGLLIGLVLMGCAERKRQRECFSFESKNFLYRLPLSAAPRQNDPSPDAQSANWEWRAALVGKELGGIGNRHYDTKELDDFVHQDLAANYRQFIDEARATATAWRTQDGAGIKTHSERADALQVFSPAMKEKLKRICPGEP
jgi:hypothetical protein